MDEQWNPIEALKGLVVERALDPEASPIQLAKKYLEENLPMAVMAICHMATYSQAEAIRFNAAKFVVERTMGATQRMETVDGKHAWEEIYEHVLSEAENYLKSD